MLNRYLATTPREIFEFRRYIFQCERIFVGGAAGGRYHAKYIKQRAKHVCQFFLPSPNLANLMSGKFSHCCSQAPKKLVT